jgi:hypothetical protein
MIRANVTYIKRPHYVDGQLESSAYLCELAKVSFGCRKEEPTAGKVLFGSDSSLGDVRSEQGGEGTSCGVQGREDQF